MFYKVIGISGSPRNGKNTDFAVQKVLAAVTEQNPSITTEFIPLSEKTIGPCTACGFCKKSFSCSIQDDFNNIISIIKDPAVKALVIGSPVYMGGMTSNTKAFLDRSVLFRRNDYFLKGLFGAAVSVGGSRNGGQELVLQGIHAALLIHDMIIVGDGKNTAHFGGTGWERVPGGIENDPDSLNTFSNLGKNLASCIERLK